MQNQKKCICVTSNGHQCTRNKTEGKDYCKQHSKNCPSGRTIIQVQNQSKPSEIQHKPSEIPRKPSEIQHKPSEIQHKPSEIQRKQPVKTKVEQLLAKLFGLEEDHIIKYEKAMGANNCGIFLIAENPTQISVCQLQSLEGQFINSTLNFCGKIIKCINGEDSKREFMQLKAAEEVGIGPKIYDMKIINDKAYILQENLPYQPIFISETVKRDYIKNALYKLNLVYQKTGLYNNDAMALLQCGCRKKYTEATIDDYLIYDWGLVTNENKTIILAKNTQQQIAEVFLKIAE